MFAADQLGEELLLLFRVRPAANLIDAKVRVRAVAEADRRRGAGDLLLCDDMLEIAEPEPAPLLLDGDPVKAELTHLRPQMLGEFVRFVDLGGDRRDLLASETFGRLADRIGHFAEAEIEAGVGHRASPVRPGA